MYQVLDAKFWMEGMDGFQKDENSVIFLRLYQDKKIAFISIDDILFIFPFVFIGPLKDLGWQLHMMGKYDNEWDIFYIKRVLQWGELNLRECKCSRMPKHDENCPVLSQKLFARLCLRDWKQDKSQYLTKKLLFQSKTIDFRLYLLFKKEEYYYYYYYYSYPSPISFFWNHCACPVL